VAEEEKAAEGGGPEEPAKCPACEECVAGAPTWMATFSDLVTLLLTFFVLLLSMAKTETAKYEAAMGSIRNAFGGNVLVKGEVIQLGKSSDDSPTMLESQQPIRPFPIEFLTMEGLLDKHQVNRSSDEDLASMKSDLYSYGLSSSSEIQEMPEGIKVNIKDKILFEEGSVRIADYTREVFDRLIKMMSKQDWTIFVQGHASLGETITLKDGTKKDAYYLSSIRAQEVTKFLIKSGVRPEKVTAVFYGDSRPDNEYLDHSKSPQKLNRRVEFILRKRDLRSKGHKVNTQ
jgi:chemotaxis protein MotB